MSVSGTMNAVRQHTYGGPQVLTYEPAPRPMAQHGEVLVKVRAAGVNPVDWKTRAGKGSIPPRLPHPFPLILGWDLSGTVVELGEGVHGFGVGDEVFGLVRFPQPGATYAEYAAVPAEHLAHKPRTLGHREAAAVPLAALTAWQALFEAGGLRAGQRVLVHAAAGGVGHFAVQLAHQRGAQVIGTASAANQAFLRELGVDQPIDYASTRFEEVIEPVDVVLDSLAGEVCERSWQVLKPGGVLVSILGDPASVMAEVLGVRAAKVYVRPDAAQLAELASWIDQGRLRPWIEQAFPLAEAAAAHALGERGHVRGKLVLEMG